MVSPAGEITQLLAALKGRKRDTIDKLIPLVYSELRKMARQYLSRERTNHSLEATALVHEAYLKLVDQRDANWQNRAHFFGVAAQIMRRVLIDRARANQAQKRGGMGDKLCLDAIVTLPLDCDLMVQQQYYSQLIMLDDSLSRLEELDPQQCRVVELRFFGGLTEEEISEVLEISVRTVRRDWRAARAWLYREITK
ncbi:MAG TPA: sigma-70 family RNA polymerase sigma factor [Candidatus Angelobacter sp.]|jgi:RNA polymerase sigma factor (TIGR02999 family)|nr:sigma-70 family RNA polymerase sigma factor [Candidatus Angelobacter sp.]